MFNKSVFLEAKKKEITQKGPELSFYQQYKPTQWGNTVIEGCFLEVRNSNNG